MSTSILYHGFGIQEHRYLRTEYSDGALIFHLERSPDRQRCAICGSLQVVRKGQRIRRIRTVPIGSKPVFLVLHLNRLQCRTCGGMRQEPILVSSPRSDGAGCWLATWWSFCGMDRVLFSVEN